MTYNRTVKQLIVEFDINKCKKPNEFSACRNRHGGMNSSTTTAQ